jgi:cell division septum initiation protein DivIVA
MDVSTLAASAMSSNAAQSSQNMQIAMLKQQNQQEQSVVNMLQQAADTSKAMTAAGVGQRVDISA